MIRLLMTILGPLLRVAPRPPSVPEGALDVKVFRASPRYLSYLYLATGLTLIPIVFPWLVASTSLWFASAQGELPRSVFLTITIGYGAIIGVSAALAFVSARLDYELHVYVTTDRCLRIRRGIWEQVEATLTYANVQNVRVTQGPLERLLGIASVVVDTAGGGGRQKQMKDHRGVIRGVENAEELRDQVMARMRASRSAGLGDPDDHHESHDPHAPDEALSVALLTEIRDEAKALAKELRGK